MKKSLLPKKSTQSGFTLIELVVVIVVLAILAVTAAPRFLNLKDEALLNSMKGLEAAINSAASMAYGKALIDNVENDESSTISYNGQSIDLVYGYPAGTDSGIALVITAVPDDWNQRASVYSGAYVYWHGAIDEDAGTAQCYIRYRQPTGENLEPVIDFVDTGC